MYTISYEITYEQENIEIRYYYYTFKVFICNETLFWIILYQSSKCVLIVYYQKEYKIM